MPTERRRYMITETDDVERRREVIIANAGALSGTYEPGHLEQLRQEWPE